MQNKKLIIWDWNGTLLNDVDSCVNAMNIMLKRRNMNLLDRSAYKNIFTFPVQDYYKILGFDFEKEPFENLSVEYIDLYKEIAKQAPLQPGAIDLLDSFANRGIKQIILSASEQSSLEYQVKQGQIYKYFDSIIGLNNIHAKSKLQNALNYMSDSKIDPKQVLLIGDTYHDYEVALEIDCDCFLVRNGHQYLDKHTYDSKVSLSNNLNELYNLVNND